jgi:hypothetical protein
MKKIFFLTTIAFLMLSACKKEATTMSSQQSSKIASNSTSGQSGTVAIDWYKLQLRIILNSPAPPNGNRFFGYQGITLYETVRNGIPGAVSLHDRLYQMPEMPAPENNSYAWAIAANAALADITRDLFINLTAANQASIDSLEKAYNEKLKPDANSQVATRSQTFGKAIAAAVFEWSKSDKFDVANAPYTPPVFPGAWVPTPPTFAPAASPYLGNCRPFLQIHTTGITSPPLYAYSENPSSDFYKMVKDVYDVSKSLTDEQKTIALFWVDVNGLGLGYTTPGHEISILTQALEKEKASLSITAQAYAKAGMAQWDGQIICWRSKYTYNLIRPVTYIQKLIDPVWLPFISTPSHPEYPAGHAFITSSTMEAITSVLGKNYAFTDHTYDFRGFSPRSYDSFEAAAIEAGESRRYGGIHYLPTINTSHQYGMSIGNDIANIKLTE